MFLYHLWLCSYFLLSVSSLPVDSEENEQSVISDSREHIHNPSVDNLAKAWEKLERAQRTRFGLDETAERCNNWAKSHSTPLSQSMLCRWEYTCDYVANRIPAFIFHAKCSQPLVVDYLILDSSSSGMCQCKEFLSSTKVIKQNEDKMTGEKAWDIEDYTVSTGCACHRENDQQYTV